VAFHVLMVDDDELSVRLVQRVLEVRGFSVESAASGMEALAAIDRRRPDVIILDIMMPGMTGVEVLDRVKASPRLASIPVIMLTAKEGDEDLLASYRSGADYYVTKPLVVEQLMSGLALVLGQSPARQAGSTPPSSTGGGRSRSR
jgi:two-component system, sensor histidine kinase ChiS